MANVNFVPNDFESTRDSIIEAFKNDKRDFFQKYFNGFSEGSTLSYVIDLFAYMSTYFNFLTNAAANEPFITTARIDRNVFGAAKSLGYKPHRIIASKIECRIEFPEKKFAKFISDNNVKVNNEIKIPAFTTFTSEQKNTFTLMDDVNFRYCTCINAKNKYRAYKLDIINGEKVTIYDCAEDEASYLNSIITEQNIGNVIFKPIYYTFKQGYFTGTTYTGTGEPDQKILFTESNIDDAQSSIILKSINTTGVLWKELTSLLDFSLMAEGNFEGTYSNLETLKGKPIWINNTTSRGIQITFGDGILGRFPEKGEIISIQYFLTQGPAANYNNNLKTTLVVSLPVETGPNVNYSLSNLMITPNNDLYANGSFGGADSQSIESIRTIAPYMIQSQGRIVNQKDMEVFLRNQDIVPINGVKVISGEKYNPPLLGGTVAMVSKSNVKSTFNEDYYLTLEEQYTLQHLVEQHCILGTSLIKFADPDFVYISFGGSVYFDLKIFPVADVKNDFEIYVNTFFSTLGVYDSFFKYSNLIAGIDNNISIDHVSLNYSLYLIRRLFEYNINDTVHINVGNGIKPKSLTTYFNKPDIIFDQNLYDNHNYIQVFDFDDPNTRELFGMEETDGYSAKYFDHGALVYSLYDEPINDVSGRIYLKEDAFDRYGEKIDDDQLYSFAIGDINYSNGDVKLYLDQYDFLDMQNTMGINSFRILNLIKPDSGSEPGDFNIPYCETLMDILYINKRDENSLPRDPLYINITFETIDDGEFKTTGQSIIKYLSNDVIYKTI